MGPDSENFFKYIKAFLSMASVLAVFILMFASREEVNTSPADQHPPTI